jgi:hypothetical protein
MIAIAEVDAVDTDGATGGLGMSFKEINDDGSGGPKSAVTLAFH